MNESELKSILKAHAAWLESGGVEGERADLSEANLEQVDFNGVDLRSANLEKVRFAGASLEGARFGGANMFRANFDLARMSNANFDDAILAQASLKGTRLNLASFFRADLNQAELQGALLRGTNFRRAKLTGANLEDAVGLFETGLAHADVTGAVLPEDVRKFEILRVSDETSRNARRIFFSMLIVCGYFWLTMATTTDARLITNSASSQLPIIQSRIPIAWFYWVSPFLVLVGYVYFHLYLERLWHALATLPTRFPDGRTLDERAYPWLLTGMVRRHWEWSRPSRSRILKLDELVAIFLAWWIAPLTLFGFWLNYLPRHDTIGTSLHVALLGIAVVLGIVFYRSCAKTLQGDSINNSKRMAVWRNSSSYRTAGLVCCAALVGLFSYVAIVGTQTSESHQPTAAKFRNSIDELMKWIGIRSCANLRFADVSTKPPEYWRIPARERKNSIKAANLSGRNLRCADATGAYFASANLRKSNLEGALLVQATLENANLGHARLNNADLRNAHLRGSNLRFAILRGANLEGANLSTADLLDVDLQDAKMINANLVGAKFVGAKLIGARFAGADLTNADLSYAVLKKADLRSAVGLTQSQLINACRDSDTTLPFGIHVSRCFAEGP